MNRTPKFIREKELLKRLPFSRATLRRKMANGTFPQPRQIGDRCIAWVEAEIEEWERRVIAEGDSTFATSDAEAA